MNKICDVQVQATAQAVIDHHSQVVTATSPSALTSPTSPQANSAQVRSSSQLYTKRFPGAATRTETTFSNANTSSNDHEVSFRKSDSELLQSHETNHESAPTSKSEINLHPPGNTFLYCPFFCAIKVLE